ncbi:hypothetical protein [Pseudomonas baetica]|uniref:hypothetical protein n=1 Tax=Pseudomonas baetica TaxID=674054 RepID=UPI00240707AD|nr:hypothetical protein [Pseudomonas baetica]MDF9779068.1 hypothetical protein [Pseudomonas baetica]
MTFALSIDDFESGRFTKVARFIIRKWPNENAPSLSKAQELLSLHLGYMDFHEAQKSATATPVSQDSYRASGFAAKSALIDLGLNYNDVYSFVDSWPIGTLGVWSNPSISQVEITPAVASDLKNIFRQKWNHPTVFRGGGGRRDSKKNIYQLLAPAINSEISDVSGRNIGFFFSESMVSDLAELLLHEAIFEYVNQHGEQQRKMELDCGAKKEDLIKLPWSEAGWPGLTDLATQFIKDELFPLNVLDLYVRAPQSEEYFDPNTFWFAGRENSKTSVHEFGSRKLQFSVAREMEDDCTKFKVYNWSGSLLDAEGRCISFVSGTLFVADRNAYYRGYDLFDAGDLVSDFDAKTAHTFLKAYADEVCPDSLAGKISLNDIDLTEITSNANIVFLYQWERSSLGEKGAGAECIKLALKVLKKKYKRDVALISTVPASQYVETGPTPRAIERMRYKDSMKVMGYLNNVTSMDIVYRNWLLLSLSESVIQVDEIIAAHHADALASEMTPEEIKEYFDKIVNAFKGGS